MRRTKKEILFEVYYFRKLFPQRLFWKESLLIHVVNQIQLWNVEYEKKIVLSQLTKDTNSSLTKFTKH